ncbi:MAG: hypothetical protein NTY60_05885 [Proteobacteria bacterium]|nr:hypothetical protein [Pseudomonadota bacterium]
MLDFIVFFVRAGFAISVLTGALFEFGGGRFAVRRGFAASSFTGTLFDFGVVLVSGRRGFAAPFFSGTLLVFFVVCIARIVAQVWVVGLKVVISAGLFW